MTGDRVADLLFYGVLLILPLSALVARRLPVARTVTMVLAWVAIFGGALLLVGWFGRIAHDRNQPSNRPAPSPQTDRSFT